MAKKIEKKGKKKSREEIFEEIKKLSELSDKRANHNLDLFRDQDLGDEDIDSGFDVSKINDTANPEKSHKLYYYIQRLLRDNLPNGKSKEEKEIRERIYDEKNLFLNRGIAKDEQGIRGSDGRMTYVPNFLEVAFNIVVKWVASGGTAYDIFIDFWDMNEERGYHKEENLQDFDRLLKKAPNTPKPPREE